LWWGGAEWRLLYRTYVRKQSSHPTPVGAQILRWVEIAMAIPEDAIGPREHCMLQCKALVAKSLGRGHVEPDDLLEEQMAKLLGVGGRKVAAASGRGRGQWAYGAAGGGGAGTGVRYERPVVAPRGACHKCHQFGHCVARCPQRFGRGAGGRGAGGGPY
jgi:hypothetical protein